MTLTPKDDQADRVFHADSEYMLDIVPALILAKLLKKNANWPKMDQCIKASPDQPKYL